MTPFRAIVIPRSQRRQPDNALVSSKRFYRQFFRAGFVPIEVERLLGGGPSSPNRTIFRAIRKRVVSNRLLNWVNMVIRIRARLTDRFISIGLSPFEVYQIGLALNQTARVFSPEHITELYDPNTAARDIYYDMVFGQEKLASSQDLTDEMVRVYGKWATAPISEIQSMLNHSGIPGSIDEDDNRKFKLWLKIAQIKARK